MCTVAFLSMMFEGMYRIQPHVTDPHSHIESQSPHLCPREVQEVLTLLQQGSRVPCHLTSPGCACQAGVLHEVPPINLCGTLRRARSEPQVCPHSHAMGILRWRATSAQHVDGVAPSLLGREHVPRVFLDDGHRSQDWPAPGPPCVDGPPSIRRPEQCALLQPTLRQSGRPGLALPSYARRRRHAFRRNDEQQEPSPHDRRPPHVQVGVVALAADWLVPHVPRRPVGRDIAAQGLLAKQRGERVPGACPQARRVELAVQPRSNSAELLHHVLCNSH